MKKQEETKNHYSKVYEQDILGCILIKPDWLNTAKSLLGKTGTQTFYYSEAQDIYKACLDLEAKGKVIGITTVGESLKRQGKEKITLEFLEKVTSYAYESRVLFEQELREIRDYALHRKILDIFTLGKDKTLTEISEEVEDLIDERQEAIEGAEDEKPLSVSEALKKGVPEIRYLIGEGLLPSEGYSMIAGKAKQRKTTLALYFSLCLATKTPVFIRKDGSKQYAFPIVKQAKTLYLYGEGQVGFILGIVKSQIQGLEEILGRKITEEEQTLIELKKNRDVYLDTKEGIEALKKLLKGKSYDLVIIDPVSLFTTGDIDKSQSVLAIVNVIQRLSKDYDCAFLLIHHGRKDRPDMAEGSDKMDSILGSVAWRNSYESCVLIERKSEGKASLMKELTFEFRNALSPDSMLVLLDPETLLPEPKEEGELSTISVVDVFILRDYVTQVFNGEAFPTELVDKASKHFEVSKQRIYNLLSEGKAKGLLEKEKGRGGRWLVVKEEELLKGKEKEEAKQAELFLDNEGLKKDSRNS